MRRANVIILCLLLITDSNSTLWAGSPVRGTDRTLSAQRFVQAPQLGLAIPAQGARNGATASSNKDAARSASTFDDRCRTITEFAQLGEYDDDAINHLRHSCG